FGRRREFLGVFGAHHVHPQPGGCGRKRHPGPGRRLVEDVEEKLARQRIFLALVITQRIRALEELFHQLAVKLLGLQDVSRFSHHQSSIMNLSFRTNVRNLATSLLLRIHSHKPQWNALCWLTMSCWQPDPSSLRSLGMTNSRN